MPSKSIRLNVRCDTIDGVTPLPADALITYDTATGAYDITGPGGAALAAFGVLQLSDLVSRNVLDDSDAAYVPFVSHSGEGAVTNMTVQSFHAVVALALSSSPARAVDPSTAVGHVGPFALGPTDFLTVQTNQVADQSITIALVSGDALEVEGALNRGRGTEDAHANTASSSAVGFTTVQTGAYTAIAGDIVLYDTSGGAFTVELPADPAKNDIVTFKEAVNSAVNPLTIDGQTNDVEAAAGTFASTMAYGIASGFLEFRFDGTVWRLLNVRA